MKNTFTFILSILTIISLNAQGLDCDNNERYYGEIFDQVTMSTVTYGSNTDPQGNNVSLEMDIYQPVGDTHNARPVIILAHGGSFLFGDRTLEAERCEYWAKHGYVTATMDYRLWNVFWGLPDSTKIMDIVIKSVADMKAAVRYFRQDASNGNTYNVNPDFIFVGGLSAGAITAFHTGMMQETDELPEFISQAVENNGGLEGTSGNPGFSSEVQGIIGLSGGLYKMEWVGEDEPPFIAMHGDDDGTVPYEFGIAANIMSINGSANVVEASQQVGNDHLFVTVPGGGHTNIYTDAQYASYQDDFFVNGAAFLRDNILCTVINTSEANDISNEIMVAPNPSFDQMSIVVDAGKGDYSLRVFDQLGRVVKAVDKIADDQFVLSKKEIGSGIFNLAFIFENGLQGHKKVIFQ